MANETDQRVVELQFNNRQFEANVSQTLKTLDELKDSLKFEGAEKGFDDLERAASKLDFDGLFNNVEKIANHFTLLGKATDLVREKVVGLGDTIISTTASTVSSFGALANLGSGWNQYAEKTSSVQTIMAATRKEFEGLDNQMMIVESELGKLTWFTDETSHKFLDLVNNIGKFTSNNIKLHSAVDEMMGIATWASLSGANTTEAARAMYNLSQAISMGALTLNDWKSIENANMATTEFKQTAIDTAVELGKLTKVADGVYQAANGAEVTIEKFRETLTDSKWLDNNVLEATLTKFGGFSTKLNTLYEQLNASGTVYTSTLLDMIEAEKTGTDYTEEFNEVLEATGVNADSLKEAIQELASEENDLGYRAFKASQETKTFGEAIDYVRTAVTSGWAQTFETIFGNYEEAKALWTGFADVLYDIFVAGGEARNAMLDLWKAAGGRDALFGTEDLPGILQNLAAAFETVIGPAKRAWENIFPPSSVRDKAAYLLAFTDLLRDLTEKLGFSEEAGRGLEIVLTALLYPLKLLLYLLAGLGLGIAGLLAGIAWVTDKVLSFIAAIKDGTVNIGEFIQNSTAAKVALALLGFAAALVLSPIIALGYGLLKLLEYTSQFDSFGDWLDQMRAAHPVIDLLASKIEAFINVVTGIPRSLKNAANSFVDFFSQFDSWGEFFSALKGKFVSFGFNIIAGLIRGIGQGTSMAVSAIVTVATMVISTFASILGIHSPSTVFILFGIMIVTGLLIGILSAVGEVVAAGGTLGEAIKQGFSASNVTESLEKFAVAFNKTITGIAKGIANLPTTISNAVKSFKEYLKTIESVETGTKNAEGGMSRVLEAIQNGFLKLLNIASTVGGKISKFLEPLNNFFKRFFNNLTAGQIVVFLIASAFLTLAIALNRLSRAFTPVGDGLGKFFKTLSNVNKGIASVFKSISGGITRMTRAFANLKNSEAMKNYATSIAILSGALVVLVGICTEGNMEKIKNAGIVLASIAAGLLIFSFAMAAINKWVGTIPTLGVNLLMMALALGVLGKVFAEMQNIQTNVNGVISFLFIVSMMVGMIVAIDKLCDNALSGGLTMIALAYSIKTLVKAYMDLSKEVQGIGTGDELLQTILSFATICLALGTLMTAMSKVSAKSGIGALAGVIALKIVISALAELNESMKGLEAGDTWMSFLKLLPTLIEIGAVLVVVGFALKLGGSAMLAAGVGLAVGVIALRMAISMFASLTSEELASAMPGLSTLGMFVLDLFSVMAMFALMWGVLSIFGATAKGLGSAFLALSTSLIIIIAALKLMEYLDPSTIQLFAGILEGLIFMMGLTALMGKNGDKAAKTVNSIRNFILAFAGCILLLSLFQTKDGNELIAPMIAMVGGLIALALALAAASLITEDVKMGPIIAVLVGIGMIAGFMIALAQYDWQNVAAAGGGMAAAILAMGIAIGLISNMGEISAGQVVAALAMMLVMAVDMLALGRAMSQLVGMEWTAIAAAAGGMSVMLLAMAVVVRILGGLGTGALVAIAGTIAMTILAIDLAVMGATLAALNGLDMNALITSTVALGALLLEMGLICALLGVIGVGAALALVGAVAVTVLAADLVIMAVALSMLNGLDMATLTTSAIALGALIGELAIIFGILALIGPLAVMALVGVAAITVLAADLVIVAFALSQLNGLDMEAMTQSAITLGLVMAALMGIVIILGTIGALAAAALVGAIAMTILAADLVIIATALSNVAMYDPATIKLAADTMLSTITSLVGISLLLAVVSPAALIGATTLITMAGALAMIGAVCMTFSLQTATIDQDIQRVVDAITSIGDIEKTGPEKASQAIKSISDAISQAIDNMVTTLSPKMEAAGGYLVQGLINGITTGGTAVYSAGYEIGDNLYEGVANRLVINSPSAIGDWLGQMFGLGTAQGASSMAGANYAAGAIDGASAAQGAASMEGLNEVAGQIDGAAIGSGVNGEQQGAYSAGSNVGYQAAQGANDQQPAASQAGTNLGSALWNAFMKFVNAIKNGLQQLGGALKGTDFDVSEVTGKIEQAVGAFTGIDFSPGGDGGGSFLEKAKEAIEKVKNEVLNTDDLFSDLEDKMNNLGGGGAPGGGGGSGGGKGGGGGSAAEAEQDAAANLIVTLDELNDKEKYFASLVNDTTEALDAGAISQEEWNNRINDSLESIKIESNWLADLVNRYHEGSISAKEFNEELKKMGTSTRSATVKEWIAELTAKYKDGILTIDEYNARVNEIIDKSEEETRSIEQLNEALQNGTIKLDEYNQARAKLIEQSAAKAQAARYLVIKNSIDLLTDSYKKGQITQEEYEAQVKKLLETRDEETRSLEDLNVALQAGTISMDDYSSAFQKVVDQNEKALAQAKEDALRNAILGIGTAAESTTKVLGVQQRSMLEIINAYKAGTISLTEYYEALEKLVQQSGEATRNATVEGVEKEIRNLTAAYEAGQIGFGEYCKSIDSVISQNDREMRSMSELRKLFLDGKITTNEYNEALRGLQSQQEDMNDLADQMNVVGQIVDLQRKLSDGYLTLGEYNVMVQQVLDEAQQETRTVTQLNAALKAGVIDTNEYTKAIADLAAQEEAASVASASARTAEKIQSLRRQYEREEITLQDYKRMVNSVIEEQGKETQSIADLDRALQHGEITLEQYNALVRHVYEQGEAANQLKVTMNNTAAIYALRKEYEAGTMTLEEYTHQLSLLSDKSKEEQRSIEQLDYLLQHSLITSDEYIEALKSINEQEEKRQKELLSASTTLSMANITQAYLDGKMTIEAYSVALQKAQEEASRETRSVEELRRALQNGVIDVDEFASAIKKLSDQETGDKQAAFDESIKQQIHNIYVEYMNGAKSEEEYLDGVDRIIKMSKRERRSLKELDYQLQNNIIDYNEYTSAVQNLFDAQNIAAFSLKELAEQERATGKQTEAWQKLLKEITLDTWGFSDSLLDVSTVLRFAGNTFLNFYDAMSTDQTLAEMFGITDFANAADSAVQATEQLMLDFYKMQNPTDAAIQGMQDYYDLTAEQLAELGQMWIEYVGTAYNAIMGSYDVFNAPSWFEKEILAPDKLLENQNMYIEGERSFVEKMMDLAGKLDSEMWMDLYNGGSKNLEQVIAFWQMTDEELEAFNQGQEKLREYAKKNAEKLAAVSVMVYQEAGYDAIQAFVKSSAEAVDIPSVEEEASHIGETLGETMADAAVTKFTEDVLNISWGTLLKLLNEGIINRDEAIDLMRYKRDEHLWTLDDYSVDDTWFTEQGIAFIRAIFDGTDQEIEKAHEDLFTAVAAITTADTDLAYSSGEEIGAYFDKGIAFAVETYIDCAVSAVEKLADAMISKLEEKINKAAQKGLLGWLRSDVDDETPSVSYSRGVEYSAINDSLVRLSDSISRQTASVNRIANQVDSIVTELRKISGSRNETTNVTVNNNIDAQPDDAYIIAQETGNTIRGGIRVAQK